MKTEMTAPTSKTWFVAVQTYL